MVNWIQGIRERKKSRMTSDFFFGLRHCKNGAAASFDEEKQMEDQEFCVAI